MSCSEMKSEIAALRSAMGLDGKKGDKGERGQQGLDGKKGDKGERGEQGLKANAVNVANKV
ncbi:hypothetical protein [Tolypothrix sp. VBCCA 56010]|uniref:hypothetical protein n=1 Tax=Tolypothrix sp. VBCCA 56010 TaxID=3137731 RepID=UPI003D7EB09A